MAGKRTPMVSGLFTWPSDKPQLIASRCKKCGSFAFPKLSYCTNPDCEKVRENVEEVLLDRRGKIWSFTVQQYKSPEPFRYEPFKPFAIAMVDFPEGLRVLGIVTRTDNLRVGMTVETVAGRLYEEGGDEYLTWMWKPVE